MDSFAEDCKQIWFEFEELWQEVWDTSEDNNESNFLEDKFHVISLHLISSL